MVNRYQLGTWIVQSLLRINVWPIFWQLLLTSMLFCVSDGRNPKLNLNCLKLFPLKAAKVFQDREKGMLPVSALNFGKLMKVVWPV